MVRISSALTIWHLLLCGSAATATEPSYAWERTDCSVALKHAGRTVWRFYYGTDKDKPFFHPLALVDGTELTDESHQNHPWHHALWFSWKKINGVTFWEESKKTGKAAGKNSWSDVKIAAHPDHSARISMNLAYTLPGESRPVLTEQRTMLVSAPDAAGTYGIDWGSVFTACTTEDVILDRTPIAGQPGGKSYGGYAGLSVRFKWEATDIQVHTDEGRVTDWTPQGRFSGKAWAMDYSAQVDGKIGGIAILEHPGNMAAPTTWYAITSNLKYFSPAVIYDKPHTLKSGESIALKYRVWVHRGRWDADVLRARCEEYKQRPFR